MTGLEEYARQEANKLYPPDHEVDDPFGETGVARSDPYGYDEYANKAFVAGILRLAERLQQEDITEAGAATLREALNICGDDRGCQCEDAIQLSTQISILVSRAMLTELERGSTDER